MGGYVKRKVGFFAKMARKWRENEVFMKKMAQKRSC
jgi:hypothetical protein